METIRPITQRDAAPTTDRDADEAAARAAKDDPTAFAAVYIRHRDTVFRYLRARARSDDEAIELTAVTFERAFLAMPRYRARGGGIVAWLLRIARNAAIDGHRRRRPIARAEEIGRAETADDPERSAIASDERDRLRASLAALDPIQRDAIALRFAAGLTAAEIGLVIGKSEVATQKLISRALARLREVLHDW
jgi:RNA polymerase sigma-70 factor (ECF subfamily)